MRLPALFRTARPASAGVNLLKTFLQICVVWTTALVLFPAGILRLEDQAGLASFRFSSPEWRAAGGLLFLAASLAGLASGATMALAGSGTPLPLDCPRRLVTRGPYRWIRNPMAVAGLLQGAAVGLWFGSVPILAYVVAGGLLWNYAVRPLEERDLELRFGEDYRRYRDAVRCWIPRFTPYRPTEPGSGADRQD